MNPTLIFFLIVISSFVGVFIGLIIATGFLTKSYELKIKSLTDTIETNKVEINQYRTSLSEKQDQLLELTAVYNAAKSKADQYSDLERQYHESIITVRELSAKNSELTENVRLSKENEKILADQAQKNFEARIADFEKLKTEMESQFAKLSIEALDANSTRFYKTAEEQLKLIHEKIQGELTQKTDKVENVVKPIKELLSSLNLQLTDLEIKREKAYVEIDTQVKGLSHETKNLSIALRKPQTRGRWGELQLRNVIELAGLSEHCDFIEQHSIGEHNELRPDLIIKLPGERSIAIDAKVPIEAYLSAIDAKSDEERDAKMREHAKHIEQHIKTLSSKDYHINLDRSVDFVVLFIPGENFFSAALEANVNLIEYGMKSKVLISSPTTLISLLKAISYGWQQDMMYRNIEEIKKEAAVLYDRMIIFIKYFANIGKNINDVSKSFNEAKSSYQSRLLPSVTRFKQLGVSDKSLPQIPDTIDVYTDDLINDSQLLNETETD